MPPQEDGNTLDRALRSGVNSQGLSNDRTKCVDKIRWPGVEPEDVGTAFVTNPSEVKRMKIMGIVIAACVVALKLTKPFRRH